MSWRLKSLVMGVVFLVWESAVAMMTNQMALVDVDLKYVVLLAPVVLPQILLEVLIGENVEIMVEIAPMMLL